MIMSSESKDSVRRPEKQSAREAIKHDVTP